MYVSNVLNRESFFSGGEGWCPLLKTRVVRAQLRRFWVWGETHVLGGEILASPNRARELVLIVSIWLHPHPQVYHAPLPHGPRGPFPTFPPVSHPPATALLLGLSLGPLPSLVFGSFSRPPACILRGPLFFTLYPHLGCGVNELLQREQMFSTREAAYIISCPLNKLKFSNKKMFCGWKFVRLLVVSVESPS